MDVATGKHSIVPGWLAAAALTACADRSAPVERLASPPQPSAAIRAAASVATASPTQPKQPVFAVDAARARQEAEAVLRRFVLPEHPAAIADGPSAQPACEGQVCRWRVEIGLRLDGQLSQLGAVLVDANDGTVLYRPNDGRDQEWTLDAYARLREDGARAVAAVEELPDVKRYCARVAKLGAKCVLWLSEVPEEPCAADPSVPYACDLGVYVGESQGSHTSRHATFYVERGSSTVRAASHFVCGEPVSLDEFRKLEAALRAKPNADVECPASTPSR